MLGIHASGCYLPGARVSAAELRAAGRVAPADLERLPVAAPDEDPLTMAIEAGRAVLRSGDAPAASRIRSLALASTTLPYTLRVQSGLVSNALGLLPNVSVTEHTTSSRAAMEGLYAAAGALRWKGDAACALLIASDRPRLPGGDGTEGAAAAALLLGSPHGAELGTVDALAAHQQEDPGLRFTRRGEAVVRDVEVAGYAAKALTGTLAGAARRLFELTDAAPGDFQLAALGTLDLRTTRSVGRALELEEDQWRAGRVFPEVGDAGAAGPVLSLLAALDAAQPGDRILWLAYGAGSAAEALSVTAGPEAGRTALAGALEGGREMSALELLRLREGG